MKALSALSKYIGTYESYRQLLRAYGLKWSVNTDNVIIARLIRARNSSDLTEWMKTVKLKFPEFAAFIELMAATGMREVEALASNNLLVELGRQNKLEDYYDDRLQILEHYRFKEAFIRPTKKTFISFIPRDLVQRIVASGLQITTDMIKMKLQRHDVKLRFGDIREFFANHAIKYLMQPEIDFIQGRTSATVFQRHYCNPYAMRDLQKRALKNSKKILELIKTT